MIIVFFFPRKKKKKKKKNRAAFGAGIEDRQLGPFWTTGVSSKILTSHFSSLILVIKIWTRILLVVLTLGNSSGSFFQPSMGSFLTW